MASSTTTPEPTDREPTKAVSLTLRHFESEVGGREELIKQLLALEGMGMTPEQQNLLASLIDPANEGLSLAKLCARAGLTVGGFLAFLQRSKGATKFFEAYNRIYDNIPEVVEDSMRGARVREVLCSTCKGRGSLSKSGGGAKRKADGTKGKARPRVRLTCVECSGTGKILIEPNIERVRLALGLAGFLEEKGSGRPLVALTQNTHVQAGAHAESQASARSATFAPVLDRFLSASDKIMYRMPIARTRALEESSEERVVDAEISRELPESSGGTTIEEMLQARQQEQEVAAPAPSPTAQPPRASQTPFAPPPFSKP